MSISPAFPPVGSANSAPRRALSALRFCAGRNRAHTRLRCHGCGPKSAVSGLTHAACPPAGTPATSLHVHVHRRLVFACVMSSPLTNQSSSSRWPLSQLRVPLPRETPRFPSPLILTNSADAVVYTCHSPHPTPGQSLRRLRLRVLRVLLRLPAVVLTVDHPPFPDATPTALSCSVLSSLNNVCVRAVYRWHKVWSCGGKLIENYKSERF